MGSNMNIDNSSDSGESSLLYTPRNQSSSATSYDMTASFRSASPASVMSLDSNMVLYKRQYGRMFNNFSDVYCLPADEEEFDRLELQHRILYAVVGEKYPTSICDALAEEAAPAETKACVDLGCGTGEWMLEVALDFPHVKVVGIDLIPPPIDNVPENLRTEIDDVNLGMEHYYGDFDVVNARLISSGVKDYHWLVDQMARVVRPGGLVCLTESDLVVYDVNHQPITFNDINEMSAPWWARWMHLLRNAVKEKGGDLDAANHLHDWVCQNPVWEQITKRTFWLPVVCKPQAKQDTGELLELDNMMETNAISFLRSGRPLLLGHGLEDYMVEFLEHNAAIEVCERVLPQFLCLQVVTARRKHPKV